MGALALLLDKAKKTCSIASDMALAQRLGVTRSTVSYWRSGQAYPTDSHIAQLSSLAGDDMSVWLVAIATERAEDGSARKAWHRIAELLGHAAAVALVAVLMNSPALSQTAERFTATLKSATKQGTSIHYARFWRAVVHMILIRMIQPAGDTLGAHFMHAGRRHALSFSMQ